jgi:hypothetical protein
MKKLIILFGFLFSVCMASDIHITATYSEFGPATNPSYDTVRIYLDGTYDTLFVFDSNSCSFYTLDTIVSRGTASLATIVHHIGFPSSTEIWASDDQYVGSYALTGSGTAIVFITPYDTATPGAVAFSYVTLRYLTGETYAVNRSNSSGVAVFAADSADTFVVMAERPGYQFLIDTIIIDTSTYYDSLRGAIWITASTADIYIYASDLGSDILEKDPRLFVELVADQTVKNTCNNTVISKYDNWVANPDPLTGKMSIELTRNSCLSDTLLVYHAYIKTRGGGKWDVGLFRVPDTTGANLLDIVL